MKRLPLEIPVVWLLFAVVALELVVTYARFDPASSTTCPAAVSRAVRAGCSCS